MATTDSTSTEQPSQRCRLVLAGPAVAVVVRGGAGFGNYAEVVAEHEDLGAWLGADSNEGADLLIAKCPTLFPETIEQVQAKLGETGIGRAVVVYEFTQQSTHKLLADSAANITALRAPITAADLVSACEADIALANLRDRWATEPSTARIDPVELSVPERQFTDGQLARMSQISTTVDCECPHHLTALLNSLNAFEKYSFECENRDEDDAMLHAYLHRSTARARAIMEDALAVLAEAEGIPID